ncbi:MAG: hypothetical protein LBQ12_10835, partial [Deltaproteobacteria bacterium]|nr:hypothetical protein [Deltaproteobacteria bacterium]
MTSKGPEGPESPASGARCSFCGRPASGGFPLYRAAGPDGAAACWLCASSVVKLALRGTLPKVPGGSCSFCGEPGPAKDGGSGGAMAAGPAGHKLCPSCASMMLEVSDRDDPSAHAPRAPEDCGTAPPVWFGLLGGFSRLTLVPPGRAPSEGENAPDVPDPQLGPEAPPCPAQDGGPAPGGGTQPAEGRSRREAACAVCGASHGRLSRIYNITRNGIPALDICDSCLRTAGDVFDRVSPVPSRDGARCTVCGRAANPANPVLSLPGRGGADICRDCCGRFRQLFLLTDRRKPRDPELGGIPAGTALHLLFPDYQPPSERGRDAPARPRSGPGFPPPRRFPPMGHSTPTGPPPRKGAQVQGDPPDRSGKGAGDLPPFEKAMLQRHSNWRITAVGRGLDFVRRLGGSGKPCSFCGKRPGEGKEVIVLGHEHSDLRICIDCVRLYADAVRSSRHLPEAPEGARCSLCGLPVRPGLAVMTGAFPKRPMLCEICIEALDAMACDRARAGFARRTDDPAGSGGPAGPAGPDGREPPAVPGPPAFPPQPGFPGCRPGKGPAVFLGNLAGTMPVRPGSPPEGAPPAERDAASGELADPVSLEPAAPAAKPEDRAGRNGGPPGGGCPPEGRPVPAAGTSAPTAPKGALPARGGAVSRAVTKASGGAKATKGPEAPGGPKASAGPEAANPPGVPKPPTGPEAAKPPGGTKPPTGPKAAKPPGGPKPPTGPKAAKPPGGP